MKYFIGILISLTLLNCQDVKRPELPADLIPEDQMVEIMIEVYLVNAARSFDNRTIIENKMKLDSFIFKKFGIDSLQFVTSNAYYTANLDTYNDLFKRVEERMEVIKKEADSLLIVHIKEQEAKKKQDSINGLKGDSINLLKEDSLIIIEKDTLLTVPQLIDPQSTQQR